jgi:hypothetical protein
LLPQPTLTWTPLPQDSPSPSLALPSQPALGQEHGFQVRVHPDGGLAAGDLVSFEVLAPAGRNLDEATLEIAEPGGEPFAQAGFGSYGIGRRFQSTLTWAWDTRGLPPGDYPLIFTIQPAGITWTETLTLLPQSDFPSSQLQADWVQGRSDCCTVNYVTGTAAERDLNTLLLELDSQAQDAASRMNLDFSEPITVTLLPRLLGHGGFASDEIHISYLDRNYAGGKPEMVLHHEMIHILDSRLGGDMRPSILVEGLAVYLTGGHFKPEPLMPRAAALLETWGTPPQPGLDWFIPLESLAENFYQSQHEIGYLEAGALVEFMVQTWGWQAFNQFYRDIHPDPSNSQAQALEVALLKHFGMNLSELEARFVQELRRLPAEALLAADVRLNVQFYDAVRRYQQALDPSAYFLTVWLPDSSEMRQRGIVADYMRHPSQPANVVLEILLVHAAEQLQRGSYPQAEQDITAVNAVLDALAQGWPDPFAASLVSAEYAAVVEAVQRNPAWVEAPPAAWISPQRIWIEADQARVWVGLEDARLVEVLLQRDAEGTWQLLRLGQLAEQ